MSGYRAETPDITLSSLNSAGFPCDWPIFCSPDRFARDLTVQLTGHDFLRSLGIALIPATAPDFFTEDTPTALLVRQVLGAIAQFDKASLVAKLKAARDNVRRQCAADIRRHRSV